MPPDLDAHYTMVLRSLVEGRVIPLLGAGVNRCGRPDDASWVRALPPDGGELSRYLAEYSAYPGPDAADLVRVSQYFSVMLGAGPLYDELRDAVRRRLPADPVHRSSPGCPASCSAGTACRLPLIVTTNYDDALERAFDEAGEPYDLVDLRRRRRRRGSFMHRPPGGERSPIEMPNEYRGLSLDERTVILKIHGAVDRARRRAGQLRHHRGPLHRLPDAHRPPSLLPVTLAAKLRRSHFLFLGYSLRDWNLRVILHRIWGEQQLRYRSWAIQLRTRSEMDRRFWERARRRHLRRAARGLRRGAERAPRRHAGRAWRHDRRGPRPRPLPAPRAVTSPYRGLLPFAEERRAVLLRPRRRPRDHRGEPDRRRG